MSERYCLLFSFCATQNSRIKEDPPVSYTNKLDIFHTQELIKLLMYPRIDSRTQTTLDQSSSIQVLTERVQCCLSSVIVRELVATSNAGRVSKLAV